MLNKQVKKEIEHLLRSFIAAIATAVVIAALHWFTLEVPLLLHWLAIGGAGYMGSKTMQ